MNNKKVNYYELEFDDEYSICIKGERKPTVEEANIFAKADCEKFGASIIDVLEISDKEAHMSFDMEKEESFPIFR